MTTDTDVDQLIKPVAEHDDLTFEELSKRYNFQKVSDRVRMFTRLLIKHCHHKTLQLQRFSIIIMTSQVDNRRRTDSSIVTSQIAFHQRHIIGIVTSLSGRVTSERNN